MQGGYASHGAAHSCHAHAAHAHSTAEGSHVHPHAAHVHHAVEVAGQGRQAGRDTCKAISTKHEAA
eukprot:scaffold34068_cov17-Tisochrysis_lutea.AAC.1